jgi:hypothetical protein
VNGKPHDIGHRNRGSPIPPLEKLGEEIQLFWSGADLPSVGAPDQAEPSADHSCCIDYRRVDVRALTAVLGRTKNAADPGQIVAGTRSSDAAGTPGTYVVDQRGGIEGEYVDLSDAVSLKILERCLFGAAPRCEVTERVDVPADQRREARASGMMRVDVCSWITDCILAHFRPAFSVVACTESLRFAITLGITSAAPDDCLKTGAFGTDSLAYGWHGTPPNTRSIRADRQVVKSDSTPEGTGWDRRETFTLELLTNVPGLAGMAGHIVAELVTYTV